MRELANGRTLPVVVTDATLSSRRLEEGETDDDSFLHVDRLLEWLQDNLIDSTGHRPGVTTGSFRPAAERAWATLRPPAAEARAKVAARARR